MSDDGREMKVVSVPPDQPSAWLMDVCRKLHEGHSPFSMVMVIGCYTMMDPRTGDEYPQVAVASHLRKDQPEDIARLAGKLRQVLADLDRIVASAKQPAS